MARIVTRAQMKALGEQQREAFEQRRTTAAHKVFATPELLTQILCLLDTPLLMNCMLVNTTMHKTITNTSKLRAHTHWLRLRLGTRFNRGVFSSIINTVEQRAKGKPIRETDQIEIVFKFGGHFPCRLPVLGSRWRGMRVSRQEISAFDVHVMCKGHGGELPMEQARTVSIWPENTVGRLWREVQGIYDEHKDCVEYARLTAPVDFRSRNSQPAVMWVRMYALGPWVDATTREASLNALSLESGEDLRLTHDVKVGWKSNKGHASETRHASAV